MSDDVSHADKILYLSMQVTIKKNKRDETKVN